MFLKESTMFWFDENYASSPKIPDRASQIESVKEALLALENANCTKGREHQSSAKQAERSRQINDISTTLSKLTEMSKKEDRGDLRTQMVGFNSKRQLKWVEGSKFVVGKSTQTDTLVVTTQKQNKSTQTEIELISADLQKRFQQNVTANDETRTVCLIGPISRQYLINGNLGKRRLPEKSDETFDLANFFEQFENPP